MNLSLLSSLLCRLAPYRGWFPVICSLCCSNFVYFYCFHSLKANWLKGKQSSSSVDLTLGIAAGEISRPRLQKLGKSELKFAALSFLCPFAQVLWTCWWPPLCGSSTPGWSSRVPSFAVRTFSPQTTLASLVILLLNWSQDHFICRRWAICGHFFQMRFCRLSATRAWALCGTAPSRPSCWCWTPPSSSWFMKDWRGSWRKAFPGRWVRGEIKWGLGLLEYVKTKND